jgi:signal transduction histidine kinase
VPALKMRALLLFPLLFIPAALTIACLLVVRADMQREIHEALELDLKHSAATYRNIEQDRRVNLTREALLLAEQPSLKALLTTQDTRTIQNEGADFQALSGADLFAFATPSGNVVALYANGVDTQYAASQLEQVHIRQPQGLTPYLLVGQQLFEIAGEPVYFGSRDTGTLLGYVIIGSVIDDMVARRVSQSVSAEVSFVAGDQVVGSTLNRNQLSQNQQFKAQLNATKSPVALSFQGTRYLSQSILLDPNSIPTTRLVVMKSMQSAMEALTRLNQLLLGLGTMALFIGGSLAFLVARALTSPLEGLVKAAHALGTGDYGYRLPVAGAAELQELGTAFQSMRDEIRKTQAKLLEAERLATIGQMASSVSHDLRHYLASVYANAEFLATSEMGKLEKAELLAEIQLSVHGTTDLIDSLLLFTQTGRAIHGSYESVSELAERAIALVRPHPEAALMTFHLSAHSSADAWVDAKKVERAIYNLLLNACQASRLSSELGEVLVDVRDTPSVVEVRVTDTGPGVPASIRDSLFEPFVSAEKENGIGIGLTLVMTIAKEHGGSIVLETSEPGKTTFRLTLNRSAAKPGKVTVPQKQRNEL